MHYISDKKPSAGGRSTPAHLKEALNPYFLNLTINREKFWL